MDQTLPTEHDPTHRAPETLIRVCTRLREVLGARDYTVDGITRALGPAGAAALERSDPAATRRAAESAGDVGVLVRLFVLSDPVPREHVEAALPGIDPEDLVRAGLLAGECSPETDGPGGYPAGGEEPEAHAPVHNLRGLVDLRPIQTASGPGWVLSDIDGSMVRSTTRPDHVLGVGQASLSLLRVSPTSPVGTLLDLGTGCGIQLVHGLGSATHAVGTDLTARCLDLAAGTLALCGHRAELLRGSWFEPVAGRRFDRIVSNPPFVIGPNEVGHTYRESGLVLDGAGRVVVAGAVEHLAPGGTATILASWVVTPGADWRSRVAGWLPDDGVEAWVLQRDLTDPEHYVWTWLTDEGVDPRDPEGARAATRWLDHLAAHEIEAIGFGYVYLRRIVGPTEVTCEDLTHPFESGLGDEAEAHFARSEWLRQLAATAAQGGVAVADLLDATVFHVAPDVHLHDSRPLGTGGDPETGEIHVVERTAGPRWRHEVDQGVRMLLAGMQVGALPLADLVALAAAALGQDPEEAAEHSRPVVVDLLRHGVVHPAGVPGLVSTSTGAREATAAPVPDGQA